MLTIVSTSHPSVRSNRSSAKASMSSYPFLPNVDLLEMSSLLRRSFTIRFQRNGDKTPPCGQPFEIFLTRTSPLSWKVINLLFTRNTIQLLIFPLAGVSSKACLIALCGMLSKAPSISRNTPSAWFPCFSAVWTLLVTLAITASVECPFLKPYPAHRNRLVWISN